MAKDIEPKLKLISDYLKINDDEIFCIPEYQREYSWNILQCDKLWQDIEDFMNSDSADPYFFGTIIVDCSIDKTLSLIDGQQRTTTFLLLLKALLIRIGEVLQELKRDEHTEALEEGLKDSRNKILEILYKADVERRIAILKDWDKVKTVSILCNHSINEKYKGELEIIINAEDFDVTEHQCYKNPCRKKDNKYTNFFKNFKFFYENLKQCGESKLNSFAKTFLNQCQIIEIRSWQIEQAITMFNSLNSTGMPLSDANIISAQLYSKVGDDKIQFKNLWNNIIELSNRLNVAKIINIDSVLQEYMYIHRAATKAYSQNDVTTPGVRAYYTIIRKDILDNPIELCQSFYKIVLIWDEIKNFPIIKLLLKFNENIKIYLISYLYRYNIEDISIDIVTQISECLIRLFAIREVMNIGYSSSLFKTFLFSENIKLVDNNISIQEIKEDFNIHINKYFKQEEIKSSILEYDKNILVYLNEYIYAKNKKLSFDFTENVNIEHIMPASGNNIETIRKDASILDKEEFRNIVNKLGNKILLEDNINKSLGNEWFKTKKQHSIKEKLGYKDSKYNIAKSLTTYYSDKWSKQDIEFMTDKVSTRILKFIFNES